MRRSTSLLILAALLAAPAVASAQVSTDLAVTRQQIQADRQAIVAQNLPLTEAQAAKFWPMYQEYRAAVGKIADQRINLLMTPTAADTATDKEINDALNQWVKLGGQYAKLQGDWIKKFQPVLGSVGTVRFYQIETRLDLIVQASLASQIPLVPVQ
jgi:Spy/CpxP family protein refolding chaperone